MTTTATTMPPHIAVLSGTETDRLLVEAERARLAEIDDFWGLCRHQPHAAESFCSGAPAIARELLLLARCGEKLPRPADSPALVHLTAQLLAQKTVLLGLPDAFPAGPVAHQVNTFWDEGTAVGCKIVGELCVTVLRFDGPLFERGTIAPDMPAAGPSWSFACEEGTAGAGAEYECPVAYLIGTLAADDRWRDVQLDLADRSALAAILPAMEWLVRYDSILDHALPVAPLTAFPACANTFIAQLRAHQALLRSRAARSAPQAELGRRTAPLYRRIEVLRRRMRRMEDEMHGLRCQIAEVEARTLEEETAFARGDTVRQRSGELEGVLEVVPMPGARFRLRGTSLDVTDGVRRGEWGLVDGPLPEPDAASAGPNRRQS